MAEASPGGGLFLPSLEGEECYYTQPLHSPRLRHAGLSHLHDFKRRRYGGSSTSPQSVGTRPTTADSDRGGDRQSLAPTSWQLLPTPSSSESFVWVDSLLGGGGCPAPDTRMGCSSPQQQQQQWDSGGSSSISCLSYLQQQQQRLARLRKPSSATELHFLHRPVLKRKGKHTSQGTYAQQARAACRVTSNGPMLPANGPLVARSVQPRSEAERQARCLLRRRLAAPPPPCNGTSYATAAGDTQYWQQCPPPDPYAAAAPFATPLDTSPGGPCFPIESDLRTTNVLPPPPVEQQQYYRDPLPPRLMPAPPLLAGPLGESGASSRQQQLPSSMQAPLSSGTNVPLPRSANARAAISSYPFPPAPLALLPKLRNARHQQLFREYLKVVHDPMRVQLGHFLIEHCLRSLPDEYMKADSQPDPSLIVEFGDQIITAVQIFGHETHFGTAQDTIPSDINETYIFNWIHQNRALLRPLELLLEDRRRGIAAGASYCYRTPSAAPSDDGDLYTNRKRRGSTAIDSTDFYERHAVPSAINCENLPAVIANAGLLVRLPHQSFTHCRRETCYRCSQQPHSNHKNHLLFNLLIAGRGDTRRCRMQMPWGEIMYIKYNRTLLGIPDFVVSCLGLGAGTSGVQVIPKVCAVSLEEAPAGVEILLLYRGLPCVKKKLQSIGRYIPPWTPVDSWQSFPSISAASTPGTNLGRCFSAAAPSASGTIDDPKLTTKVHGATLDPKVGHSQMVLSSTAELLGRNDWTEPSPDNRTDTTTEGMRKELVSPSSFERQQYSHPAVQYEEQELQTSEPPCPLSPASAQALQTWSAKVRLHISPPASPCRSTKPLIAADITAENIAIVDYGEGQPTTPSIDLWKATDCDPPISPESCGLCEGSVEKNRRVKFGETPPDVTSALWPVFVPSP